MICRYKYRKKRRILHVSQFIDADKYLSLDERVASIIDARYNATIIYFQYLFRFRQSNCKSNLF